MLIPTTALGYLYSSISSSNITKANARGVLAAACLLEGMDDLCNIAYQQCRDSITLDTIQDWVEFVSTLSGNSDGTQSPLNEVQRPTVLGPYATRLRADVLDFLITDLPKVCGNTPEGRRSMLNVFARVPFELFKATLESPAFLIGTSPCSLWTVSTVLLTETLHAIHPKHKQDPNKKGSDLRRRR